MADSDWNKKFAFYAVALYRIGNYTDAALYGSLMFERAIFYRLEKKYLSRKDLKRDNTHGKGLLQYAIDRLQKEGLITNSEKDDLHLIRSEVRNNIVHKLDLNRINRRSLLSMLYFVWKTFDRKTYENYGNIPELDFLSADYAVTDVREILHIQDQGELEPFESFKKGDFRDLHQLRKKFVLLRNRLNSSQLLIDYNLKIDILSKINTTSAYVWMSMLKHGQEMSMLKHGQRRQRIREASVSILGTPLDLRIYMDFGGEAFQKRQYYYDFLKTEDFVKFWKKKVKGMPTSRIKDIEIFDIDWFSFIIDREPLKKAIEKIQEKSKKAEDELKENKDSKITWNRLLCGYIIKRKTIKYQEIKKKLDIIIQFYNCFENYIKRNKQD